MENVEMLQRSFENYLRVKPGKITVDITLADRTDCRGIKAVKGKTSPAPPAVRGEPSESPGQKETD